MDPRYPEDVMPVPISSDPVPATEPVATPGAADATAVAGPAVAVDPGAAASHPAEAARPHRAHRVRRMIADLLILAGLLVLLYPAGTWGYAWWEQRGLEKRLVETHPALAQPSAQVFSGGMIPTLAPPDPSGQKEFRSQEEQDRRLVELRLFRKAAEAFVAGLAANGGGGGEPIGRINIPSIGVNTVMVEGVGRGDLREGPGHWPETPFPGMGGNFVVSGHRTTYGGPFFKLDKLKPGDEIRLMLPYAAATYRVTKKMIVLPTQTEVVAQRSRDEISLATCHPIYSAKQRLVIQAELASFKLLNTP